MVSIPLFFLTAFLRLSFSRVSASDTPSSRAEVIICTTNDWGFRRFVRGKNGGGKGGSPLHVTFLESPRLISHLLAPRLSSGRTTMGGSATSIAATTTKNKYFTEYMLQAWTGAAVAVDDTPSTTITTTT